MIACGGGEAGGSESDGGSTINGWNGIGSKKGGGGGGGVQVTYISGPTYIVLSEDDLPKEEYTYKVTGANELIFTISNLDVVNFTGSTAPPSTTSTSWVSTQVATNGTSIHTLNLRYVGTSSSFEPVTVKIEARDLLSGYKEGDGKVVTVRTFKSLDISMIEVKQTDVPTATLYDTDDLDTLKEDDIWENFYVSVTELHVGKEEPFTMPIKSTLFDLTWQNSTGAPKSTVLSSLSSDPFTAKGGIELLVAVNTTIGDTVYTNFTITPVTDTIYSAAQGGWSFVSSTGSTSNATTRIQDLLLGAYDSGDETDILSDIQITVTWHNTRSTDGLVGTRSNGVEVIDSYDDFVAGSPSTTGTGSWSPPLVSASISSASTGSNYTQRLSYGGSYADLTLRLLGPTDLKASPLTTLTITSAGSEAALKNSVATALSSVEFFALYSGAVSSKLGYSLDGTAWTNDIGSFGTATNVTDLITVSNYSTGSTAWPTGTAGTVTLLVGWPDTSYPDTVRRFAEFTVEIE